MSIKISFEKVHHSQQHKVAWDLLCDMLKGFYDIDFNEDMIAKNPYGKPYLTDYPEIHFNLSHSEGVTACITDNRECGIDCEKIREYRPNVMKRAFTESEREMVEKATESERNLLFFTLWTLKEAYIKAIGKGLSFSMNEVEFQINNGNVTSNITDYEFKRYILRDGEFVVATAIKKKQVAEIQQQHN